MEKVDSHKPPPPFGFTGDWSGLRVRLKEAGINVAAAYISEAAYNYSGGALQTAREAGQFVLTFSGDASVLTGFKHGQWKVSITDRRGEDLGAAAKLGTLQQIQEVFGRGQTLRLTQFSYEQKLESWSLKLGRTTVGEDFDSFPCYFMNLSLCGSVPGNLAGSYWYNWPVSQWSGRARFDIGNAYIQSAVYEANPRNLENSFSFGHTSGATGVLVPLEMGWGPENAASHGLGIFKIGAWYTDAPGDGSALGGDDRPPNLTNSIPLRRNGRYGFWFSMQQQLWGDASEGAFVNGGAIFLNITFVDHRTASLSDQQAFGFWWKGFIPTLPDDVLGIGISRTSVNALAASGQVLAGGRLLPNAEYVGEIYVSLHPFSWIEMRPNLQLIHNPGGLKSSSDIGILGLKSAVTF